MSSRNEIVVVCAHCGGVLSAQCRLTANEIRLAVALGHRVEVRPETRRHFLCDCIEHRHLWGGMTQDNLRLFNAGQAVHS